jgi:hypothetical protein
MSSAVFPSFPGLDVKVHREPVWDVKVQPTLAGKEVRSFWSTYPRYRYALSLNALRSSSVLPEFQSLCGFVTRHGGKADSFLFTDAEDSSVTDHGFGVGDGATTAFQLQRSQLAQGTVYDNVGGPWGASSKPRTNLCTQSQTFDNAAWTKFGATLIPAAAVAPDGTATAQKLVEDTSGSLHNTKNLNITYEVGKSYVHSVFVKPGERKLVGFGLSGAPAGGIGCNFDLATGTVTSVGGAAVNCTPRIVACGGGWFRISIAFNVFAPTTPPAGPIIIVGNDSIGTFAYTGDGFSGIYIWGAQVEQTSATIPSAYIPTVATTVTVNPAYWPSMTDGFEPIFEPNGPVSVFVDKDWQGYRQLFQTARTNLCFRSQTLTDASWTKTNLTDNGAVTDPAGGSNARSYTSTATATAALSRSVAGLTAQYQYTASVWLRCAAGGTVKLSTTEGASATLNVTSTWQRFTWTFNAAGASTTLTLGGSSTWPNTEILEVFAFQLELGALATSYIITTTAAVTVTDITSITLGAVTFTTAPACGNCPFLDRHLFLPLPLRLGRPSLGPHRPAPLELEVAPDDHREALR